MIFVNSMSDLFHDEIPDAYIARVCEVMSLANWHTFQVLTKRSGRMADMLRGTLKKFAKMPHIWWGVSVEDKKHGLPRIADLKKTPATVKFLSIEPLLEDLGTLKLQTVSWVIVGGESGRGARPIEANWVRSIRDQCAGAKIPFFFKQWGGERKKKAGRVLDGATHDGFPAVKQDPVLPLSERRELIGRFAENQLITISL
jgi:protein gp37